MKIYSVTIRVDGRDIETKPFYAKNSAEACVIAELNGRINFPKAEEVDAVNVEYITNEDGK